jgi:hypothetical protein
MWFFIFVQTRFGPNLPASRLVFSTIKIPCQEVFQKKMIAVMAPAE